MSLPDRLPPLTGQRATVVTWAWRLLFALAAAMAVAGVGFNGLNLFRDIPQTAWFGFRVGTDVERQRVVVSSVTAPAAAAGLREGDRILAVNERRFDARLSEAQLGAALARAGARARIELAGATGPARVATLERRGSIWSQRDTSTAVPLWAMAAAEVVWRLLFVGFLLFAALLLHLRRPRDPEAMLLAFAFPLLTFSSVQTWWLQAVVPVPWAITQGVPPLGWLLILIAMAGFPDGRFLTLLARGTATLLPLLFAPTILGLWPRSANPAFEATAVLTGLSLVVVTVNDRYRATPPGEGRQQLRWAVLGFAATAAGILLGIALDRVGADREGASAWTYFANVAVRIVVYTALPAGLLVSQLRYRLYDADAAISRSAAYGALTLALLGVFAASEKVLEVAGERWLGQGAGALAAGLAAAVAAVAIAPLHHRVSRWAEQRFQQALLRLRQGLPLLLADLRQTADSPAVAAAALDRIADGVRASRGAIIANGTVLAVRGAEPVDVGCDSPLFPVRLPLVADGMGEVGTLLLGPRPDGSLYGKDEREVSEAIVDPLARALHVARVAAERRAATEALSTRVAELEKMVARLTRGPSGLGAGR